MPFIQHNYIIIHLNSTTVTHVNMCVSQILSSLKFLKLDI